MSGTSGAHSQNKINTSRMGATGAVPRNYKPPRDRPVPTQHGADCPTCKAVIGDPCISLTTGFEQSHCHTARRRMALRAEREKAQS